MMDKLNLTIHEILRYGFTGTIALFVMQMVSGGRWPKPLTDSPSSVATAAMLALSMGAILYAISRHLVVEPSVRLCIFLRTKRTSWFRQFTGNLLTRHEFLATRFHLGIAESEVAFFVLRAYRGNDGKPLWSADIQEQLYRQHSENHLIFATSLILALTIPLAWIFDLLTWQSFGGLAFFAVFFFLCGSISDIRIFMREATLMELVDRNEGGNERIPQILRDAGIISLAAPSLEQVSDNLTTGEN